MRVDFVGTGALHLDSRFHLSVVPTKTLITFKDQLLVTREQPQQQLLSPGVFATLIKSTPRNYLQYTVVLSPSRPQGEVRLPTPKAVCRQGGFVKKKKSFHKMLTVTGLSPRVVQPRNESMKQQRFRLVMMSAILGTVFILAQSAQLRGGGASRC